MVKLARRRKIVGGMALCAVVAECCSVYVLVAGSAFGVHPHESLPPLFYVLVGDMVGLVALSAINLFVGARKRVVCQVVVELLFVEAHHVKIAPVVVAVALGAVLGAHFGGGVVPSVPIHRSLYLAVAVQTTAVGYLVADFVALGAVGQSLQILVRIGQRTGGQLCLQPKGGQQGKRQKIYEFLF